MEKIQAIQSREELVDYVFSLLEDLRENPNEWENRSLEQFLSAIGAWMQDMDGYYRNIGKETPNVPSWKIFAEILTAAKYYE